MGVMNKEVTQKGKPSPRWSWGFGSIGRSRRKIHAVVNPEGAIDLGSNSKKWSNHAAKKTLVVNAFYVRTVIRHRWVS